MVGTIIVLLRSANPSALSQALHPVCTSLQQMSLQPRRDRNARHFLQKSKFRRNYAMSEGDHKNWRELCSAALEARDPDELLTIVQELKKVLKCEEKVRRDFREAGRANKSPGEIRC